MKTKTNLLKHITVEKVILLLAAGFAAYNFSMAGGYIEHGELAFSFGGLIAGLVVNISLAIAASYYGSIKGNKRTAQARAAFVLMLVLSPALVSPVVYYSLPDSFLAVQHADVWYLSLVAGLPKLLWSLAWPLVADLAIVLAGAVSGKGGLLTLTEQSSQPAGSTTKPARKRSQTAEQTQQSAKVYECNWPGCEWTTEQSAAVRKGGDPQAALAAHVSHHNRAVRKIEAEKQKVEA